MIQTEIWTHASGKQVTWDCPNRPGQTCGVHVEVYSEDAKPHTKVWSWDCNEAAPTLSPSVHCLGVNHGGVGCGWHGFIRNGMLESV
jgi:Family of unknown function (DUF6527)